ncbi:MAG: peptide ABC transporter substrate-binding protein, partial [Anaerolineae bacterium]|nr:peptide ABC transporter substrate-binding protein [Anaerolineae bacterium]
DARLAFAKAIDREQYVKDVLRGIGKPTTGWIAPGIPGNSPQAGADLKYDPAAAKAAWDKAAYTGEVKLTYSSSPRNKTRFEFLAAQLQKNLGLNVTLDPVEATTFTALQKDKATFPLVTLGGWCSDYPDPQNWMSVYWDSHAFAARYGYKNETVDNLQRVADAESDPLRRTQLYQEAEKLVLNDVAVAPLYHSENVFLVKPYVKGYTTTPQDHLLGEFTITQMTAIR